MRQKKLKTDYMVDTMDSDQCEGLGLRDLGGGRVEGEGQDSIDQGLRVWASDASGSQDPHAVGEMVDVKTIEEILN